MKICSSYVRWPNRPNNLAAFVNRNIFCAPTSTSRPRRRFPTAPHTFHIHQKTMASIPNTMKGVVINKTGGTEVLEHKTDLPVPQPKEGQVLVKNDFIGINYIDTYAHSPHSPHLPSSSPPHLLGSPRALT